VRLRVSEKEVCDRDLYVIIDLLDDEGDGHLEIGEIVNFVAFA